MKVLDVELFKVACEATDITIKESKSYGKHTVIVVSVKHASQLYEAGLIQSSLDLPINEVKNEDKPVSADKYAMGYEEPKSTIPPPDKHVKSK